MTEGRLRKYAIMMMVMLLSGCATANLQDKIEENEGRNYSIDWIAGFAVARYKNGPPGVAFIGEHFDYKISGGERLLTLIQQHTLAANEIQLDSGMKFVIKNSNRFSGTAAGRFVVESESRCHDIAQAFAANVSWRGDNKCEFSFPIRDGEIHRKASPEAYQNINRFNKPTTVGFYNEKSSFSALRLLYPATVAVDVVTSPLQLIGVGMVLGGVMMSSGTYH